MRKTLKQKLKSQNRGLKQIIVHQHELAGVTINFEQRKLQSIAVAHGIMASMLSVKNHFGTESDAFKAFETEAQGRIAQCVQVLLSMGLDMEEINHRLQQGY